MTNILHYMNDLFVEHFKDEDVDPAKRHLLFHLRASLPCKIEQVIIPYADFHLHERLPRHYPGVETVNISFCTPLISQTWMGLASAAAALIPYMDYMRLAPCGLWIPPEGQEDGQMPNSAWMTYEAY